MSVLQITFSVKRKVTYEWKINHISLGFNRCPNCILATPRVILVGPVESAGGDPITP